MRSGSAIRWRSRPSTAKAVRSLRALRAALPAETEHPAEPRARRRRGDEPEPDPEAPTTIRVAVVGRPNTGKSTLINRLLGEDRLLTGPEAGITRDAIAVDVDVARPHLPPPRHRRHAAAVAHRGEAREAVGRRHDQRHPLRRGGDRADGLAAAVRGAGPAHRRPGRARGPRGRDRHEQVGPGRRQLRPR